MEYRGRVNVAVLPKRDPIPFGMDEKKIAPMCCTRNHPYGAAPFIARPRKKGGRKDGCSRRRVLNRSGPRALAGGAGALPLPNMFNSAIPARIWRDRPDGASSGL